MGEALAEVLNHYLATRCWSFERLAEEAGLPRNTVYRWTRGEVRRVRHWQDLASAARALELTRIQANVLLGAGAHPPIEQLLKCHTDEEDQALLSRWAVTVPHNLPAQLTSFVGREQELEQVTRLLASARLVTLTGPGGSGKTRLALEAAQAVLDDFDEACFVDLAPIRDPKLVILTISQALGLGESLNEPPLRAVATQLRDRNVLLVLDNLEQVIEAASYVTDLLGTSPGVKALVTSRSRLNVRGEHEFVVHPLPLPCPASGFEELTRNPSVALFADRARAANPAFTLSSHNAHLVAEVCACLDGLPLGIELAAARTRQVRLYSMRERCSGRLALANGGPRDVPERQRTLRATIAWSYDLLDPEAQALFASLGVFAGGFTEEAARTVCSTIRQLEIDVSEGLESLVEQSLIARIWEEADEPRYEMLETIREYALEK